MRTRRCGTCGAPIWTTAIEITETEILGGETVVTAWPVYCSRPCAADGLAHEFMREAGTMADRIDDLMSVVDGHLICNACNVLPTFMGEHRCFRSDAGRTCECPDPLCRLERREVTIEELEAERDGC